MILQSPGDGWTKEENLLFRSSVLWIYKKLPTVKDKFIVLALYDAGYSQSDVAFMMGVSQACVSKWINKIKKRIKETLL